MANEISGGGEVRVNTATQFNQISGKGVALAGGGFVVVWDDSSSTGGAGGDAGGSVRMQLFDANGAKVGVEILVNTATASSQGRGAVTALANGGFVVTWEDYSGGIGGTPGDSDQAAVKAQVFTATGTKVGVEILVNSDPTGDQVAGPPVALSGGGFVVSWNTFNGNQGTSETLRAEVFAADGTRVASGLAVDEGANNDTTIIALDGNRFAVLWTDIISPTSMSIGDHDVRIRIYEGNGNPVGDSFTVNASSSNWQNFESVARIAGGGFVVTWEAQNADFSSSVIMAQRFDASGAKIGVEFPVSATTTGFRGQSEVTQLGNGGFVVSWTYQAAPSDNEVRAQLFDAAGVKIGGEFSVNTATAASQENARLVSVTGGGFVAIWDDVSQGVGGATGDNNGRAIKGQLFDSTGTPVGTEFLVNVAIRGRQQITDVVALPDGRFAVIWDDASQGVGGATGDNSGLAVKMQVFQIAAANGPTSGDDNLSGTEGDDLFLLQQGGNDTIDGRGGNDLFYLGTAFNAGDAINGGGGSDQVVVQGNYAGYTLGASNLVNVETLAILSGTDTRFGDSGGHSYSYNLTTVDANVAAGQQLIVQASDLRAGENLTFDGAAETDGSFLIYAGAGDDVLTGGAGNDTLIGGAGDDTLDGNGGTDTMSGGDGNDIYVVESADDVVIENANEGIDIVKSTVSYVLGAGASVELLRLIGTGNINATGNADAQKLVGNSGDNVLDGGGGGDVLRGGLGNDTYIVRDATDRIVEVDGNGSDIVKAAISYTLAADVSVETLRTIDDNATTAIDLVGNSHTTLIVGNAGVNRLTGGSGDETLTGGGGADIFAFVGTGVGHDTVGDFVSGTDRLDLTAFFADFSTFQAATHDIAGNAVIDLGNGETVTLSGVPSAQIQSGDVITASGQAPLKLAVAHVQHWINTDAPGHAAKDIWGGHFFDYVEPISLPAFQCFL